MAGSYLYGFTGMNEKERHDFHKLAGEQGQHRNGHETFDEYYKRVKAVEKARENPVEVWRRDSGL